MAAPAASDTPITDDMPMEEKEEEVMSPDENERSAKRAKDATLLLKRYENNSDQSLTPEQRKTREALMMQLKSIPTRLDAQTLEWACNFYLRHTPEELDKILEDTESEMRAESEIQKAMTDLDGNEDSLEA